MERIRMNFSTMMWNLVGLIKDGQMYDGSDWIVLDRIGSGWIVSGQVGPGRIGLVRNDYRAPLIVMERSKKQETQWLPIFRRIAPEGITSLLVSSMRSKFLGTKQTSKGSGVTVTPALPRKLGKDEPCGDRNSNVCINELKNKNNSMRANTSPRHIRLPTPKGIKYSGFWTLPSAERNRLGRNSSGSSQSSGSICTACNNGTTWDPAGIV